MVQLNNIRRRVEKVKRRIEKKTVLLIQKQEYFAVRNCPDEGLLQGYMSFRTGGISV